MNNSRWWGGLFVGYMIGLAISILIVLTFTGCSAVTVMEAPLPTPATFRLPERFKSCSVKETVLLSNGRKATVVNCIEHDCDVFYMLDTVSSKVVERAKICY